MLSDISVALWREQPLLGLGERKKKKNLAIWVRDDFSLLFVTQGMYITATFSELYNINCFSEPKGIILRLLQCLVTLSLKEETGNFFKKGNLKKRIHLIPKECLKSDFSKLSRKQLNVISILAFSEMRLLTILSSTHWLCTMEIVPPIMEKTVSLGRYIIWF